MVYRPLGFLDRLSTNHYSSRAWAASGAASDVDRFSPYKDALFANQPVEIGRGLDDELAELGRTVEIDEPLFATFADAVSSGRYLPWMTDLTRRGPHANGVSRRAWRSRRTR